MSIKTDLIEGHRIVINPESPAEVCRLIGTNRADVGWVCSRGSLINKWAKFKPVILQGVRDTTPQLSGNAGDANRPWKSGAAWWKADNGLCGLGVIAHSMITGKSDISKTPRELLSDYDALVHWFARPDQWALSAPQGGAQAPFRIIDFHYYDHDAVCFVKGLTYPTYEFYHAGDNADTDAPNCMKWQLVLPASGEDAYSLSWNDIVMYRVNGSDVFLGDFHLGLLFVNVGSDFSDFSNFTYRKFIVTASAMIKNGGTSITLTGRDTAALVNDNNVRSEQNYDIYPVFVSGTTSSLIVFGSQNVGNLVVVPNASPFRMRLLPNELDGIIMGELDSYDESGEYYYFNNIWLSLLNTNASKTMSFPVSAISLEFQIWRKSGNTYSYERSVYGAQINATGTITMAARGSASVSVRYPVPKSYFIDGAEYGFKIVGTIDYSKTGGGTTVSSRSTLLSLPPTNLAYVYVTKTFRIHASLVSVDANKYSVNVWVENLRDTALDFSWSSVLAYDLTSYPKTAQGGTDYQDALVQTGLSVTWTSETVAARSVSQTHTIADITPRQYNHGYYAIARFYAKGTSGMDVGQASVSAEWP